MIRVGQTYRINYLSRMNFGHVYDSMGLINVIEGWLIMVHNNEKTLYEHMGGAETVRRLVEAFYPRVQRDPLLAPLFPKDIMPVLEKQYLFLTQFFGGPSLYTEQYGQPMMRARHLPFPIANRHAAAWLNCMQHAMKEIKLPDPLVDALLERLKGPAYHFVNTPEDN